MSTQKEKIQKLLELQKTACSKAIGGTSKSAKNTRARIEKIELVEIPTELHIKPAPIEVVKEVPRNVERIVYKDKEVVKEVGVQLYTAIGAIIAALCVGFVVGLAIL